MWSERRKVETPEASKVSDATGILYVARRAARKRSAAKWQSATGEARADGDVVLPKTSLRSASVESGSWSSDINDDAFARKR
eukprot:749769-Pleurochrysis_carterae.AAC.1